MRTQDIITDDLVSKFAVKYAGWSGGHDASWKATKMVMVAAAEIAASQLGTPLEATLMSDDGTWLR